jgi:hypothetical protein
MAIEHQGHGVFLVSPENFKSILSLSLLGRKRSKYSALIKLLHLINGIYGRFGYDNRRGLLKFAMPTFIHSACSAWLAAWVQLKRTKAQQLPRREYYDFHRSDIKENGWILFWMVSKLSC